MDTATTAFLVTAAIGVVIGVYPGYKSLTENSDGPAGVALLGALGAIIFGLFGVNAQSGQASGVPVEMGITGGVGVIIGVICGAGWGDHVANPRATK